MPPLQSRHLDLLEHFYTFFPNTLLEVLLHSVCGSKDQLAHEMEMCVIKPLASTARVV